MSDAAKMQIAATAARSGAATTEFQGKTAVQLLVIAGAAMGHLGLDVQIDEQTAIVIVAGLEAAYTLGRSIVKAVLAWGQSPTVTNVLPGS